MDLKRQIILILFKCKNKEDERDLLKRELSKQINDKKILGEVRKFDKEIEVAEIEKNQQIIKEIKQDQKDKKEENIKNSVAMWNLQQKMRKQADKLQ